MANPIGTRVAIFEFNKAQPIRHVEVIQGCSERVLRNPNATDTFEFDGAEHSFRRQAEQLSGMIPNTVRA
jgi:hypothetical protein